ncbi:hypothetical protein PMZ80_000066 [Knufia obscura]|uniref:Uncharacterized protein n=2 Tax=Knufia TaxID=430999 RepID=A0AAN8E972_9EURO|nr:hypothetical protein PMZ80_000066 [Knufia obscura]KAK5948753.1 hypothetical protein OHC33_010176 [Knufia fluminis]
MATCYNRYTRQYYSCTSRWGDWGRWVALAVILIVAFLFFFLCACISQRRRRKAGRQPFQGTGWMATLPGGAPPAYKPNDNYQAPPQYGNQNTNQVPQGGYYGNQTNSSGANQSYFGGRNDVEMQPPQNVYTNEHNYAPPSGPPPNKLH